MIFNILPVENSRIPIALIEKFMNWFYGTVNLSYAVGLILDSFMITTNFYFYFETYYYSKR